jgi:hypothetical protein
LHLRHGNFLDFLENVLLEEPAFRKFEVIFPNFYEKFHIPIENFHDRKPNFRKMEGNFLEFYGKFLLGNQNFLEIYGIEVLYYESLEIIYRIVVPGYSRCLMAKGHEAVVLNQLGLTIMASFFIVTSNFCA